MGWLCCCGKNKGTEKGEDGIILCPRCKRPMAKKSRMGVTIDKCEKCNGIWLDGGEIENILAKTGEARKKQSENHNDLNVKNKKNMKNKKGIGK